MRVRLCAEFLEVSLLGIVGVIICALALLGWAAWYLLAAPRSQWLCPARSSGLGDRREIALTFDDGPGIDTPAILDILRAINVKATFFLCGANVERFPDTARRIADEGHVVGNHAYSHRRFIGKSAGWMLHEIELTSAMIHHCVRSDDEVKLFRPPYGLRWFGLRKILQRRGLDMVMWDVNSEDWKRTPEEISARVVRMVKPGSIVLLHDGVPPQEMANRRNTVAALAAIVSKLKEDYRLVTVPELIGAKQRERQLIS